MTPIIWLVTFAVIFVLVSFIWVVISSWQNEDEARLRESEENVSNLTLEDLTDVERSFN